MLIYSVNETIGKVLNSSSSFILCAINGTTDNNCTFEIHSSGSSIDYNHLFPNSVVIICVLSVLSIFGVCFMIFGPLQRSEAYKRVENFTFGRHPIFNVDHHREPSNATRFDESMEFADD